MICGYMQQTSSVATTVFPLHTVTNGN